MGVGLALALQHCQLLPKWKVLSGPIVAFSSGLLSTFILDGRRGLDGPVDLCFRAFSWLSMIYLLDLGSESTIDGFPLAAPCQRMSTTCPLYVQTRCAQIHTGAARKF